MQFLCIKEFDCLTFYIEYTFYTTDATCGYPSGASELTPGFSGVLVTRSLVLCVSIYGLSLPFMYLQTFLFFYLSDEDTK